MIDLKLVGRSICVLLPIIYGMFIWWQSSTFDPESVSSLTYLLGPTIVKIIGTCFELAHLLEFGFLYLLIIVALLSFGGLAKLEETLTFCIAFMYGLLDELHQYYVPFRSTSLIDLIKDLIGILVVWFFIHRFYYKENSKLGSRLKKICLLAKENDMGSSM